MNPVLAHYTCFDDIYRPVFEVSFSVFSDLRAGTGTLMVFTPESPLWFHSKEAPSFDSLLTFTIMCAARVLS